MELGRVSHAFSQIYTGRLKIIFDSMQIFAYLFVFELQNSFRTSIKDENHLPVCFTEREREREKEEEEEEERGERRSERGGVVQQRGDGRGKTGLTDLRLRLICFWRAGLCGKGKGAPGSAAVSHLVLLTA